MKNLTISLAVCLLSLVNTFAQPACKNVLISAVGTDTQTVCITSAIEDIVYKISDNSVSIKQLPTGLTATVKDSVLTISGKVKIEFYRSNARKLFYLIEVKGKCNLDTLTGNITVVQNYSSYDNYYYAPLYCLGVGNSGMHMYDDTPMPDPLGDEVYISYKNIFYETTGDVVLDSITGVIDLVKSKPGNYEMIHYSAAHGGCPEIIIKDSVKLIQGPKLTVNSPTICYGDTVELIASGADHYLWENDSTTNSIKVSPTQQYQSFEVSGSINGGCANMTYSHVTVQACTPLTVDLTLKNTTYLGTCDGKVSAKFKGGVPPYFYTNFNLGTEYSLPNMCTGNYSFLITDSFNNTINVKFTIEANDSVTILASNFSKMPSNNVYTIDSLIKSIENCDIDYNNIDSVRVDKYTRVANDSITVFWRIYQNGNSTTETGTYYISEDGWHCFLIDVHCNLRSGGSAQFAAFVNTKSNLTSVDNITLKHLSIYPNPNNGSFTISSALAGNYSIVNEYGQTVLQFALTANNHYAVNGNILPAGLYVVVGDNGVREKIVVIK